MAMAYFLYTYICGAPTQRPISMNLYIMPNINLLTYRKLTKS